MTRVNHRAWAGSDHQEGVQIVPDPGRHQPRVLPCGVLKHEEYPCKPSREDVWPCCPGRYRWNDADMTSPTASDSTCLTPTARRWLLGLEPFFEGGWLHKGARARAWDVENDLIGLSVFGDVSIDLSQLAQVPGITTDETTTIQNAVGVLDQAGYTGTMVKVAIDGAGFIREVTPVATFSDGGKVTLDATFSNFGCRNSAAFLPTILSR